MSVVAALERELELLRMVAPALAESAFAATALTLAAEMDNPSTSATAKAMCAGRLYEALNRLRELTPPKEQGDGLDELAKRRQSRMAET